MALYSLIKPFLFCLDAETAHRLVTHGLAMVSRIPGFLLLERGIYGYNHPALRMQLWERDFANPLGLAAGFDKDALLPDTMLGLGFGFVEVGTVTPRAQPGNSRPRLFRLPKEKGLINRMGFNNRGALRLAARLERKRRIPGIVGVNLGKNLDTPLEEAATDYLTGLHAVHFSADYIVINLSSPNTPGLRKLQEKPALMEMTRLLVRERDKLSEVTGHRLPFLIKIAPDLSEGALADIASVARRAAIDGLIATNTTTERPEMEDNHSGEEGGLSGQPLREETLRTVSCLYRLTGGKLPIIGVGGVGSPEDAYALIRAGASLVQIYSALVFRGPGLVRKIKRGLVKLLSADGFSNIFEAVGSASPTASSRILAMNKIIAKNPVVKNPVAAKSAAARRKKSSRP
jgi:dihydroorotate dehydrogenase